MLPVWLAINGSAKLVRLCCCAANDHWCGIYRPVASVSASVPLFRLDDAQRYAAPLMKAVLEISKRLGTLTLVELCLCSDEAVLRQAELEG